MKGIYDIEAQKYLAMSNEDLFDLVKSDKVFKSAIVALIDNFKGDPTCERFLKGDSLLSEWCWETSCKFEYNDYSAVVRFSREALKALTLLQLSPEYLKRCSNSAMSREQMKEEAYRKFLQTVPEAYKEITIESFSQTEGQKKLVSAILKGSSLVVHGSKGLGKTALGWAIAKALKKEGEKKVDFLKFYELTRNISSRQMRDTTTDIAGWIDATYVAGVDVLIVDEVDKLNPTDSAYANFYYLIDRRWEERKQTILLLNSIGNSVQEREQSVQNVLGTSIFSRFTDKAWKAKIIALSGEDKRVLSKEAV